MICCECRDVWLLLDAGHAGPLKHLEEVVPPEAHLGSLRGLVQPLLWVAHDDGSSLVDLVWMGPHESVDLAQQCHELHLCAYLVQQQMVWQLLEVWESLRGSSFSSSCWRMLQNVENPLRHRKGGLLLSQPLECWFLLPHCC